MKLSEKVQQEKGIKLTKEGKELADRLVLGEPIKTALEKVSSKTPVPEHIKKICRKCPDVDCPFEVCYFPKVERGLK